MMIDWASFTPWSALLGGTLIGLAAAILFLGIGRIAGISGIFGGLLQASGRQESWRWYFLVGLLIAPWLYVVAAPMPEIEMVASPLLLVVAGLLVGFGTRYASGCTSGHGVCGLSRLSVRSLAATLSFMAMGFVTVFVMRHLLGVS
ncbi:MAG: YeeE/YedE thiosulfate transporter family protein [Pseudomonadota bacterium]|nr:YeeE/YedE thiosulfate transporter family protein [Pseudomonadota bacterium]